MARGIWVGLLAGGIVAAASANAHADFEASGSVTITNGTEPAPAATTMTTTPPPPPDTVVAPEADRTDRFGKTLALGLSTGLGSPLGYVGAFVNIQPHRFFSLELGGGLGGKFGPAIAEMLRGHIASLGSHFGISLGLGFSQNFTTQGERDKFSSGLGDTIPGVAHFFNAEITGDYRSDKGYFGRLGVGLGTLLNANKFKGACGQAAEGCFTGSKDANGLTPQGVADGRDGIAMYIHLDLGGFFHF